jgi:hypothetical protein
MWQKVAEFKGAEYFRKALYIFRTELNVTLIISLLFFQIGKHCATGGKSLHFSSCHQVPRDLSDTTHNLSSPRGPQRHQHGHDIINNHLNETAMKTLSK